jgi:transcriptional antiterminator RfaH
MATQADDGRLVLHMSAVGRSERWFLVHAQPYSEIKAQLHLQAQGFRTFLPLVQRTTRHARQFRTSRAPLFPRYLFVVLSLDRDRWRSVYGTVGVSTVITSNGRPSPVPIGVVESLINKTTGGSIRMGADLAEGHSARITSGPFTDLVGRLVQVDAGERVRILLDIMGTSVPLLVGRDALSPAA